MAKRDGTFIDREKLYGLIDRREPSRTELESILSRALELKGLPLADAAALLCVHSHEGIASLLEAAGQVKELIYGKRIVLFAPLYVGNACSNNCTYCSFRKDNYAIRRKVLDPSQIVHETELLLAEGHKRVLLIGGEAESTGPDYYLEALRAVYSARRGSDRVRRVNLEIAPMAEEDFARFKDEGIGTYICFQETYDEKLYGIYHPSGKKADYSWRLDVMDRAMRAGLGDVGIGALFGLADRRFEVLALLEHARHLEEAFGVGPHTVSVPRIEHAEGAPTSYAPPHRLSDDQFRVVVAVIRLALPFTGIILSTREGPRMRDELIRRGVSQVSAGSRTSPGGYSAEGDQGAQFDLGDLRSLDEVISSLADSGHVPSFCTGCYRRGRVGKDFMDLAKPGLIHAYCRPNGLFTFKEYLEDYATPGTKTKGEALLASLLSEIEDSAVRDRARKTLERIAAGERDLYL